MFLWMTDVLGVTFIILDNAGFVMRGLAASGVAGGLLKVVSFLIFLLIVIQPLEVFLWTVMVPAARDGELTGSEVNEVVAWLMERFGVTLGASFSELLGSSLVIWVILASLLWLIGNSVLVTSLRRYFVRAGFRVAKAGGVVDGVLTALLVIVIVLFFIDLSNILVSSEPTIETAAGAISLLNTMLWRLILIAGIGWILEAAFLIYTLKYIRHRDANPYIVPSSIGALAAGGLVRIAEFGYSFSYILGGLSMSGSGIYEVSLTLAQSLSLFKILAYISIIVAIVLGIAIAAFAVSVKDHETSEEH